MSELIVSVSGIRGIVGEELTPAATLKFAEALATHANGGRIVVSNDGRPSGAMLKHAVLAGLLGTGCEVHDLGIAPTPTFGLAIRKLKAAGGIQITASHNPAPWNGLKLFGPAGAVLSPDDGEKIRQIFEHCNPHRAKWDKLGNVQGCQSALAWHRDRVLELVDVVKIRSRQFKVLVDANGGSGGPLSQQLLESLQVRSTILGANADGLFQHEPEPTAANLAGVCPRVAVAGADFGCALDPDADRLALIDETGRYIGEELTLALAVACRLRQEKGPVVINMSTSRVVVDIARQFGVSCHRSAVGEANVVVLMKQIGAVIGGEGNGGVIDPRVGWVRDPFIGMALVLSLLADTGKTLSTLVAELPSYTIVKEKYSVARESLPKLFDALLQHWPHAEVNRVDGLRLDWPDRWIHVRPSNTEPIIRVIAEAPTEKEAGELCREVGERLSAPAVNQNPKYEIRNPKQIRKPNLE
jgi:phosphomannomutase